MSPSTRGTPVPVSKVSGRAIACATLSLALAVLVGCVSKGTHRTVLQERDDLAAENEGLRREKKELQTRLGELEAIHEDAQAQLSSRAQEAEELKKTYNDMVSELKSELAAGEVRVRQLRDGLSIDLTEDILFATGSAELNDRGREVLRRVSSELERAGHLVTVQGYTDNIPIHTACYPSNWELAGARSASVVRLLQEAGLGPDRLLAVSYGENDPVASNATEDGRSQNRRIEIRLKPVGMGTGSPASPSR